MPLESAPLDVSASRPIVVATAILGCAGRGEPLCVLAAQRSAPHVYAGLWEFPGGKLEPGEDERDAVVRECKEELGVVVEPVEYVSETALPMDGWRLRLWAASLRSGTPTAREHSALTWADVRPGPHGADRLDWIPADRPLLEALRHWLGAG